MKMAFTLIAASALWLHTASAQAPAPTQPAPAATPPAPAIEAPPAATAAPAPEKKAAPAAEKSTKKKTAAKKPATKSAPAAPEPPDNPTPATVKGDRVNVRGKASLVGEVITQLKKGESVTVLSEIPVKSPKAGEPAAWAKIVLPANVPVWVHASYVDAATKTVKSARLNVRAGPGENYSVIGHLKKGETYKDIRQIDDWIEIEAPAGTFGYVTANLVVKGAALTQTKPEVKPAAEPKSETVKIEPAPAPATPAEPVVPAPAPKPAEPAPAVTDPPAPAPFTEPKAPEQPIKRIVTREGIVRYTVSLRAPSQFSLVDADSGRTIAYLITDHKDLNFHHLVHQRYVLTGEEFLDERWKNRTVLRVDTVEAAP